MKTPKPVLKWIYLWTYRKAIDEMPSLLSWKEVPANQRTLQGQSACCCLSSCVRPPKGQKWIIQGHHNLIRSPGHFLFQWVEVYCVWGMCVCVCVLLSAEMRLQFGVKEERKPEQCEASAVPLHLLAALGMKSVCLADWMWGCLHNKGISFCQRWPSTCLLNEFDIGMDTVRRKSDRKRSQQSI